MNLDISYINSKDHWLIYLIIGITCLALITLLVIIGFRIHHHLTFTRRHKFRSALIRLLSGVVNFPDQREQFTSEITQLLKEKWQYEILLDELLLMCYSFQGVYEDRSKELYYYFKLETFSQLKLNSRRWNEIIEGIIELSIIGDKDSYKKIIPFLDHKEWQVRKQAKIAIIELGEVKGLVEMESKMGIMSRWTFLSILSILHRSAFKITPSNLALLKKSKNPSMQKLIPYLEQYAVIY